MCKVCFEMSSAGRQIVKPLLYATGRSPDVAEMFENRFSVLPGIKQFLIKSPLIKCDAFSQATVL